MGNSAMDVARTSIRNGAREVTLYARGLKWNSSEKEAEYAKLDGAKFEFAKNIVEITDEGPIFQNIIYDEDGSTIKIEEDKILYPADSTIVSISQGPKSRLVNTTEGLKATEKGLLQTDEKGNTTIPGIFAAGDVVLGAKTVVEAVAYSKTVAQCMDEYMQGLE